MKKKTYIVPVLKVYRIDPVNLLDNSPANIIHMQSAGKYPDDGEGNYSTDDTF